jgi:proteic killer suppression protein
MPAEKVASSAYYSDSFAGVQSAHAPKLRRVLATLDAASSLNDLNHPGYRLHPLKGHPL